MELLLNLHCFSHSAHVTYQNVTCIAKETPFLSLYLGASLPSIVAIYTRVSHSFSSFYPESDSTARACSLAQSPIRPGRASICTSLRRWCQALVHARERH